MSMAGISHDSAMCCSSKTPGQMQSMVKTSQNMERDLFLLRSSDIFGNQCVIDHPNNPQRQSRLKGLDTMRTARDFGSRIYWRTRGDSNARPADSKSDALSN
jgi:hypothetical protein